MGIDGLGRVYLMLTCGSLSDELIDAGSCYQETHDSARSPPEQLSTAEPLRLRRIGWIFKQNRCSNHRSSCLIRTMTHDHFKFVFSWQVNFFEFPSGSPIQAPKSSKSRKDHIRNSHQLVGTVFPWWFGTEGGRAVSSLTPVKPWSRNEMASQPFQLWLLRYTGP